GGGNPWIINSGGGNQVSLRFSLDLENISFPNSLRIDLKLEMEFSENVSFTVEFLDQRNGNGWVQGNGSGITYEEDVNHDVILSFINKNSQFINDVVNVTAKVLNFTITATSTVPFSMKLNELTVKSYNSRTIEITADNWVGLSFDLRGNATVKGVWLWIRSLNLSSSENLILEVFQSNDTGLQIGVDTGNPDGIRTTGLAGPLQIPVLGSPVSGSQITISDYTEDGEAYFDFPSDLSLSVGNYYLVLRSDLNKTLENITTSRYSLLVLPWNDDVSEGSVFDADDDPKVNDHTFVKSGDSGSTWVLAESSSGYEFDAAPFKVELNRRLIPSDLDMAVAMTDENVSITDVAMLVDEPISNNNYEWGIGSWNPVDQEYPSSGANYELELLWNATTMADFTYNASMDLLVYSEESITSSCSLDQDKLPAWKLEFTFNRSLHASWTGIRFNFTYPGDWNEVNLTYPDNVDYFDSSNVSFYNSYMKDYSVTEQSILALDDGIEEGTYTFNLESPNYIEGVQTYLNYNDTHYYQSSSFMDGDNMSARIHVQDSSGMVVLNGHVNLTLFRPAETELFTISEGVINNTLNFTTSYHFSDANLHHFTGADASGTYKARGFWFNGSEAGIDVKDVFKLDYNVDEFSIIEDFDRGTNIIQGHFTTGLIDGIGTNIEIVSINNTKTPVNLTMELVSDNFVFFGFNQSETIFNPGELIEFSLNISSNDYIFTHNIDANIEVYQYNVPDRVVMNLTMANPVELAPFQQPGFNPILNLSGNFPIGDIGYNAPVRNTLYGVRVKLYLDGTLKEIWSDPRTLSIKVDDSSLDGTLLATKVELNRTGQTFSTEFNRVDETIFNSPTPYLMFLESVDGVTMETNYSKYYTNNISSTFTNVSFAAVEGDILAINNNVNISGMLMLENGTSAPNNTAVHSWIDVNDTWVPFNHTGNNNTIIVENGNFSAIFTLPAYHETSFNVKINWTSSIGDVLDGNVEIEINATLYEASYDIQEMSGEIEIFGNVKNFFTFRITNTGNTTLAFSKEPSVSGDLVFFRVSAWINEDLLNVAPGESFTVELMITTPDLGLGEKIETNFSIQLEAYSIETKENFDQSTIFNATIKSVSLIARMGTIWYVFFIIIMVALVYLAFVYVRKAKKVIVKPVKEGALAKRKRELSELEEKPLIVKKGSDLVKEKDKTDAKGYRDIDEVIDEMSNKKEDKETEKKAGKSGKAGKASKASKARRNDAI
ncbi:MAG: hypothetical protein ACTSUE_06520, partial [Promethearchaeota archaeon]